MCLWPHQGAQHQQCMTKFRRSLPCLPLQTFISSFQYNQCTSCNYNVSKNRPLQAILATAAGIIVHSLPIKCIGGSGQVFRPAGLTAACLPNMCAAHTP